MRLWLALLALALGACGGEPLPPQPAAGERPMRIVSLDYCADQYVLRLADRDQVLAVSPDAVKDFSYMREAARGLPTVRPRAEDVLILKPDLVVRSYGGGPGVTAMFERAGVPVLQMGWARSIHGEGDASIAGILRDMGDGLGQSRRGEALAQAYLARLSAIRANPGAGAALYMTPAGATSGPGSLVHDMLVAAGLENFETRPGWHALPLERLAYEQPGLVAAAFHENLAGFQNAWSAARHPIAQAQLGGPDVVPLDGAWTACAGWFLLDAVEALVEGAGD